MKTKYATNYICRQHGYSKDFRYTFSLRRIIPAGHGPFRFVSENLETVRTCCSNILLHFQLLYRKFLQGSLHQVAIFLCLVQLCIKFNILLKFLFYCCVVTVVMLLFVMFSICLLKSQQLRINHKLLRPFLNLHRPTTNFLKTLTPPKQYKIIVYTLKNSKRRA